MKLRRVFTAAALTAASTVAGLTMTTTSAQAEACADGEGVTVVVGDEVRCDADGGGTAFSNFDDAGFELKTVKSEPEFICQVDGAPKSDCSKMPEADSYWGLFVSDGKKNEWEFAQEGVNSLKVPDGGAVAFVLQTSKEPTYPSNDAFTETAKSDTSATDKTGKSTDKPDDSSATMWWIGGAIALLLIAGAAFAVTQRRRAAGS